MLALRSPFRSLAPLVCAVCACAGETPDAAARARDAGAPDAAPRDAGPPVRVLFVGNSYTSFNDLPSTVRAVVAASGAAIEVEAATADGAYLFEHAPALRERLAAGGIDRVVLQGQSLEATGVTEAAFLPSAQGISDLLEQTATPAIWFATWARRAGDGIYAVLPGGPAAMAATIDRAYQQAAEVNDDATARVGIAWQLALEELPDVPLHLADGSHPTPAGTLLAACVIAEVLLDAPPRAPSPPPSGVSVDVADALCALAPRARVAPTLGRCDGEWVDPMSDPDHCGACGRACSPDEPCLSGACGCPWGTACNRSCVDLAGDERHCGACGAPCPSGGVCAGATCACPRARNYRTAEVPGWDADACSIATYGSEACGEAADRACEALDCFATGLGPSSGHSGGSASWLDTIVCVGDADRVSVALSACAGASSVECVAAIHHECLARGAVTGFGPIGRAADAVSIACLSSAEATVVRTRAATLAEHATRCTPNPVTCSVAAMSLCETLGYAGGYGPVEAAGDERDVVCLGAPP